MLSRIEDFLLEVSGLLVILSICCSFANPPGGIVDQKLRGPPSLPLCFVLLLLTLISWQFTTTVDGVLCTFARVDALKDRSHWGDACLQDHPRDCFYNGF